MIELELTGILLCCIAILFLLTKIMLRLFVSAICKYPFEITNVDQIASIFVMFLSLVPALNFFVAYKIFRFTASMKVINRKLWRKVN